MVDTKFDRKALAQVYTVLIMLEHDQYIKIPEKLIAAIKENKDNEYEVELHELERGNMLSDTTRILAAIYTYYLSTQEEKTIINKLIYIEHEKSKTNNWRINKN